MLRDYMNKYSLAIFVGLTLLSGIRTQAQSSYTTKDPRPLYEVVRSSYLRYFFFLKR
jgi:hypothetical protein